MTLENLSKTGQLKAHETDPAEIDRLLEVAQRNLNDSSVESISLETRFDAAYKAIMQSALAALMANGYRPDTNRPGHHMTVIQSLTKTIGLPGERVTVLDALRRKRNQSDYTGEGADKRSTESCIQEAAQLLAELTEWLKENRPDLIHDP